jgi:hypothetical protein
MPDKLVTIATLLSPIEAHLLKARLAEAEIESFIIDENITLWAGAMDVKLQVWESDVGKAIQIIKETRKG